LSNVLNEIDYFIENSKERSNKFGKYYESELSYSYYKYNTTSPGYISIKSTDSLK
jgi:hypothetical protein